VSGDDFDAELDRLPDTIVTKTCAECGQNAIEFDFRYGDLGDGWIGRIYICRDCLGEEAWRGLAQVPEFFAGTGFVGRSTRIDGDMPPPQFVDDEGGDKR
jgi:hypothetical protein